MTIQAGHGRRCITPPLGLGMVGNVYKEGGYEANTTRVAPGSEAIVKAAMASLLADLKA